MSEPQQPTGERCPRCGAPVKRNAADMWVERFDPEAVIREQTAALGRIYSIALNDAKVSKHPERDLNEICAIAREAIESSNHV